MANTEARCGDCRHFKAGETDDRWGECRRYPPTVFPAATHALTNQTGMLRIFPGVHGGKDWCGEHVPARSRQQRRA